MTFFWFLLSSCAWWEARQACAQAEDAREAGWTAFAAAADQGQAAAASTAKAKAEAAESVGSALDSAVANAPQVQPVNQAAAQDAFTAASRTGDGSSQAAQDARAADYTTQTLHVGAEADRAAERAIREAERLAVWGQAYKEAALALALAAARYEVLVGDSGARASLVIDVKLAESPTAPQREDTEAAAALALVQTRQTSFGEQREDFTMVRDNAEKLAFAADRAGQLATTRARDIDFLDFPPSAQYARAASAGAAAAGIRASDAARRLNEVVAVWKAADATSTVTVPAPIEASFAAAKAASANAVELCK